MAAPSASEGTSVETSFASTTISTSTAGLFIPDDLAAFGVEIISVGGEEWLVAVADTAQERRDGLRGILELGDVDGMLFTYDEPTTTTFTMNAVTQPLEIAFFASDGSLLNVLEMTPCPDDSGCPGYDSVAPFLWAVESFPGGVTALGPDAHIDPN